jgi:hypothetical protein
MCRAGVRRTASGGPELPASCLPPQAASLSDTRMLSPVYRPPSLRARVWGCRNEDLRRAGELLAEMPKNPGGNLLLPRGKR